MTGFFHISLHPATTEDFMEDKRTVFDGPEKSTGTSSFAAKREKDDVVAVRRDFIFKTDRDRLLPIDDGCTDTSLIPHGRDDGPHSGEVAFEDEIFPTDESATSHSFL